MDLEGVAHLVPLGRHHDDTGSHSGEHLGSVKVHGLVVDIGFSRSLLGLGPLNQEVGHGLRFDHPVGHVLLLERKELDCQLGNSAHRIPIVDDV